MSAMSAPVLVKATLTHLETLHSLAVLWNPSSYRVESVRHFAGAPLLGVGASPPQYAGGGGERFLTTLFLDSDAGGASLLDLRSWVEQLERWGEPAPDTGLPAPILFAWGSFRFRGMVESIHQEWVRFDADGTPSRAWLDLVLRRG